MEFREHKSSQREPRDVDGHPEATQCDTREGTDILPKHNTQCRATSNFTHMDHLTLGKAGIVAAIFDRSRWDTEKGNVLPWAGRAEVWLHLRGSNLWSHGPPRWLGVKGKTSLEGMGEAHILSLHYTLPYTTRGSTVSTHSPRRGGRENVTQHQERLPTRRSWEPNPSPLCHASGETCQGHVPPSSGAQASQSRPWKAQNEALCLCTTVNPASVKFHCNKEMIQEWLRETTEFQRRSPGPTAGTVMQASSSSSSLCTWCLIWVISDILND